MLVRVAYFLASAVLRPAAAIARLLLLPVLMILIAAAFGAYVQGDVLAFVLLAFAALLCGEVRKRLYFFSLREMDYYNENYSKALAGARHARRVAGARRHHVFSRAVRPRKTANRNPARHVAYS